MQHKNMYPFLKNKEAHMLEAWQISVKMELHSLVPTSYSGFMWVLIYLLNENE